MELDFKQTCPTINTNLKSISEWIEQYLGDLIDDIQPNISEDYKSEMTDKYFKLIFTEEVETNIEELRDLNSEMRDKANDQLTDLRDDLNNAEKRIEELEEELSNISIA